MNRQVGQTIEVPAWIKFTTRAILTDASKHDIPMEEITTKDGQSLYHSKPLLPQSLKTIIGHKICR